MLSPTVALALERREPVVALESALITHGLPYPENLHAALSMQDAIMAAGALPATIAVIDGEIRIGLPDQELRELAQEEDAHKLGVRDLVGAHLRRSTGGTTVAATLFAAHRAGIQVFATGGIGGVHRERSSDVSADLQALASTNMIVVCAGAKSILDLPATLEMLESLSVPVLGYGCDEFPGFYWRESGLPASGRVDSVSEVVRYWARHCALGMNAAVIVANPIPEANEIEADEFSDWAERASNESKAAGVHGKALTPFLLRRIGELSNGRTIAANIAFCSITRSWLARSRRQCRSKNRISSEGQNGRHIHPEGGVHGESRGSV